MKKEVDLKNISRMIDVSTVRTDIVLSLIHISLGLFSNSSISLKIQSHEYSGNNGALLIPEA